MAVWNPLQEMEDLRRQVDRAFEEFGFARQPFGRVAFLPGISPRQYPLINLHEDKDKLYVEALTPGVDPDSLNVTVMQNRLTLSGEKSRIAADVKPEAYHRNERASGKFVRIIELPVEVDDRQMTAEYNHGILTISLAKAERAKPKQINIKVA